MAYRNITRRPVNFKTIHHAQSVPEVVIDLDDPETKRQLEMGTGSPVARVVVKSGGKYSTLHICADEDTRYAKRNTVILTASSFTRGRDTRKAFTIRPWVKEPE